MSRERLVHLLYSSKQNFINNISMCIKFQLINGVMVRWSHVCRSERPHATVYFWRAYGACDWLQMNKWHQDAAADH